MMKWIPWRWAVRIVAKSNGFIDPVAIHTQLQKFSQPAEVAEPVELLRAGVVFHARGLLNSKVIQHNLDWVWPYWVERQFDPEDLSFLPRSFSVTQVNLTHRNWTAIGVPDYDELPVVDPRGLVTPFWDGWSLDVWVMKPDGTMLLPSREPGGSQYSETGGGYAITSIFKDKGMSLQLRASVEVGENGPTCVLHSRGRSLDGGWLIVSARPYNPEGISLIDNLSLSDDRKSWLINKKHQVIFDTPVERHHTSDYHDGDVHIHLDEKDDVHDQHCPAGVVTAAAMFKINPGEERSVFTSVPLKTVGHHLMIPGKHNINYSEENFSGAKRRWSAALAEQSKLNHPDQVFQQLYENALRTLVLCTPDDVYAGPYTYKRYWYRDAVFIAYGLLRAGLASRVKDIVDKFPDRQRSNGYFHSQEGEWDSNGQVLWLTHEYMKATDSKPGDTLWQSMDLAAEWIIDKRLEQDSGKPYAGLLPAGFSAEHLGPNDYYYWDNYWAIAGLNSAAAMAESLGKEDRAKHFYAASESLQSSVAQSLDQWSDKYKSIAIPASPMRRMDAGAIGSVVTGYPLRLCPPDDPQLAGTVKYLTDQCFCHGGFFQDMIHSGINIYLTLQIAQTMLRTGERKFFDLMSTCATLATDTGTWPEAIHPHTLGGCMGDGNHAWAAAEWVSLMRNCFVREEGDCLMIGTGIVHSWLTRQQSLSLGTAPTEFGPVTVTIQPMDKTGNQCSVTVEGDWHDKTPKICVCLPGFEKADMKPGSTMLKVSKPSTESVLVSTS